MWPAIELRELQVFLTVAEELHFAHAAERLDITPSRVSQVIRELETKLGGRLFDRTSRRVQLTPLGRDLDARLRPLYADTVAVFDSVAARAQEAPGTLRLGVTVSGERPSLHRLTEQFHRAHPDCDLNFTELDIWEPYASLRDGDIDVLCNWLAVDEPDLTVGPVIETVTRVLVVGAGHRLAKRTSVTTEDLVGERVNRPPGRFPRALADAILVPRTGSGKPILRTDRELESVAEVVALIARGEIVSISMRGTSRYATDDIVLVPIVDLPPLPLGLVWCTAHENDRIRALATIAAGASDAATATPTRAADRADKGQP